MLFNIKIKDIDNHIRFVIESEGQDTIEYDLKLILPFIIQAYNLVIDINNTTIDIYPYNDDKTYGYHRFKIKNQSAIEIQLIYEVTEYDRIMKTSDKLIKLATINLPKIDKNIILSNDEY